MPTLYDLKPRFQAALRPVAARCARAGVSANAVTVAAALMSGLLGVLTAVTRSRWLLLSYPLFLLLRMALNAVDGLLARELSQPTPLGALLNELGDLVSDAALYLPLALVFPAPPWIVVVIVVVAVIAEAAGIAAETSGASRRYDGPFGKSDRALAFSALAVLVAVGVPAADHWLPAVLCVLLVLAAWTVVNRVRAAVAEAGR
jgi:CDP-diacylglycerol---glycerol-3-phosphate 3-phosphatidyltransferase